MERLADRLRETSEIKSGYRGRVDAALASIRSAAACAAESGLCSSAGVLVTSQPGDHVKFIAEVTVRLQDDGFTVSRTHGSSPEAVGEWDRSTTYAVTFKVRW